MPASERVLVTGAAAGIGRAVADRCRAEGYEVVGIDREGDGLRADLSLPETTAAALREALRGGPITGSYNVGVVRPGPVEEQSVDDLEIAVSLNFRCALQCLQALLPGMKAARFGRVVNISSRAALGKERRTVYAATKSALIGMTKYGRWNSAITGSPPMRSAPVRFAPNCSIPPTHPKVHAPGRSSMRSRSAASARSPTSPTRSPSLLDARSGFVTGQVLYVCGGMTVGAQSL